MPVGTGIKSSPVVLETVAVTLGSDKMHVQGSHKCHNSLKHRSHLLHRLKIRRVELGECLAEEVNSLPPSFSLSLSVSYRFKSFAETLLFSM